MLLFVEAPGLRAPSHDSGNGEGGSHLCPVTHSGLLGSPGGVTGHRLEAQSLRGASEAARREPWPGTQETPTQQTQKTQPSHYPPGAAFPSSGFLCPMKGLD